MWTDVSSIAQELDANHYLGAVRRGLAWRDEYGSIVVCAPTARMLPGAPEWLELSRWCITSRQKNSGSRQWAGFVRALREVCPTATTVISYSDPGVGHDGALYRACNWLWAPTWHRLRPPPTGNGAWSTGKPSGVKDRWIFPLRRDARRAALLVARDEAILRRMPWARYVEGRGAEFKTFQSRSRST